MMGIAAMAFTSCFNDTIVEVNNGHPIDFYVSANTRATELTTDNLEVFSVTAIHSTEKTVDDAIVKVEGKNYFSAEFERFENIFLSSLSYYWPIDGALNFYAYSPVDVVNSDQLTLNNETKSITDFSPAEEIKDQVDFIVAKATGDKANNATKGVYLEFDHMLTQVEVHAKNAHTGYNFYVKGVRIANVAATADFNFTPAEGTSPWTLGESIATYEIIHNTDIILDADGENLMNVIASGTADLSDNAMLLPQNLETIAAENEDVPAIQILVKVTSASNDVLVYPDASAEDDDNAGYGWMTIPITTDWLPGNKYVYTINLTSGNLIGEPVY